MADINNPTGILSASPMQMGIVDHSMVLSWMSVKSSVTSPSRGA